MILKPDRLDTAPQLRFVVPLLPLEQAILKSLAYADVFDYPLSAAEIHRYLIEQPADTSLVGQALNGRLLEHGLIERTEDLFTLPGRGHLVDRRAERSRHASLLWPRARRWGFHLARLPFVRMVAVTGALAMGNESGWDLDYLVVTTPGRLWLCRGLAMLLVRFARQLGDEVCPNYFISTQALVFTNRNLYTAHELTQMVPLTRGEIYLRIRQLNPWVERFLPNAGGAPPAAQAEPPARSKQTTSSLVRASVEAILFTPPVGRLEAWEMHRKIRRLSRRRGSTAEIDFSRDWCKGHFGGYGQKTLEQYESRLALLGLSSL